MIRSASILAALTLATLAPPALSAPPAKASSVQPVSAIGPQAAWRRIQWAPTLAVAQARARAEGKPVLLFSLFGKLDEEFC